MFYHLSEVQSGHTISKFQESKRFDHHTAHIYGCVKRFNASWLLSIFHNKNRNKLIRLKQAHEPQIGIRCLFICVADFALFWHRCLFFFFPLLLWQKCMHEWSPWTWSHLQLLTQKKITICERSMSLRFILYLFPCTSSFVLNVVCTVL